MRYYFISLLCLIAGYATGQTALITLTGTLTMQTGEQFPYKIVATDSNDILKGYAFTYAEPDETKVIIRGRVDKQRKKLTFKETEIISSHDVHTQAFMCLLHASLEFKQGKLTGPATSQEADNTACTPGIVTFGSNEEISNLFSSHDKYDEVVTMGGPKPKEPEQPAADKVATEVVAKQEKITAGVEKNYNWHADSIVVEVWDGGTFDGDRVTISLDDKQVLNRYVIQKEKKRLVIPLKDKEMHTLSIIADDEGFQPPNTANLTLSDGSIYYNLLAYNAKGKSSVVLIQRGK